MLDDDALPFTSKLTDVENALDIIEKPFIFPYTPDLSLYDHHVIAPLKEALRSEKFGNYTAVEAYQKTFNMLEFFEIMRLCTLLLCIAY